MSEKHIRFTLEDTLKVKDYASKNKLSFNEAVRRLTSIALEQLKEEESINMLEKKIDKITYVNYDILSLLEQLYSDLDFENITNPKNSKPLKEFKKKRNGKLLND